MATVRLTLSTSSAFVSAYRLVTTLRCDSDPGALSTMFNSITGACVADIDARRKLAALYIQYDDAKRPKSRPRRPRAPGSATHTARR